MPNKKNKQIFKILKLWHKESNNNNLANKIVGQKHAKGNSSNVPLN